MKSKITRLFSLAIVFAMSLTLLISPASAATFTDVSTSSWYYTAVTYCSENDLMSGYGDGTFGPTDTLTRAMFVQVLYNMSSDKGNYAGVSSGFSDVKSSAWYSDAVAWAVDKGITAGTSSTTFSPTTAVTREQMATLVTNYLNAYGISLAESDDAVASFSDMSSVSSWAKSAVEYMRVTGIISGSDGLFRPKDTATRAEAATIFWKLDLAIKAIGQTGDTTTDDTTEDTTTDNDTDTTTGTAGSHTHAYTAVVTAATCTAKGYTTYTCACGDSYVGDYTSATGHSYGSYVTTTAATCSTTGVKTKTCSVCGDTYSTTIAATGNHSYTSEVTAPTCTTQGYTTYTCSVCGDSYVGNYTSPVGHTYDDGEVTTKPTTTSTGIMTYTCTDCGATYDEVLDVIEGYTVTYKVDSSSQKTIYTEVVEPDTDVSDLFGFGTYSGQYSTKMYYTIDSAAMTIRLYTSGYADDYTLTLDGWYTDLECTTPFTGTVTSDLTLYCHMWRYTTTAITAYRYTCLYCGQFFESVNDCITHCRGDCDSRYSYKRVQIGIQYAKTCWGCGEEEVIEEDYEWHVLYLAECFTCGELYYTLDELKAHWAESEDCLCNWYIIRSTVGFGDDVTLLDDETLNSDSTTVHFYRCGTCGWRSLTWDDFEAHCSESGCSTSSYNYVYNHVHTCDDT